MLCRGARAAVEPYVGGPAYALRAAKEAIDRGLEVDLDTGLEIERMQFAALFATQDREIGMRSFVEHGPGKARSKGDERGDRGQVPVGVAERRGRRGVRYDDTKLAQVLYHDWEAQTYDEKWSISFDERCVGLRP